MTKDILNFKDFVNEEIINTLPKEFCCVKSFLSATAKITGTIEMVRRRLNLVFTLETYKKAAAVIELLKILYPAEFELSSGHFSNGAKKSGMRSYTVSVQSGYAKEALVDLCLMTGEDDELTGFSSGLPPQVSMRSCCSEAYLKGLFFACGSIYVPSIGSSDKKDGYHFELQLEDEYDAEEVQHFLLNFDVAAKINVRASRYLVYVKDRDEILRLLGIMGLVESGLKLKGIIDERETANSINRASICDAANLDKTYTAASKYIVAIEKIKIASGLESLTEELRTTAIARIEYPQSTLAELSDILKVSKSCLNHRLRRLLEISSAEENDD